MTVYCSVCGLNSAEYICLKCKKVFCGNCVKREERELRICNSCGSTNIQELSTPSGKKLLCLECGSSNIGTGKRIIRFCPICGTPVKNVNILWNEIINTYRILPNEIANAIRPISKLIADLKLLKGSLIKLRSTQVFSDLDVDKQLSDLLLLADKSLSEIEKHLDILESIEFGTIRNKEYYLANPDELEKLMANVESFNRVAKNLKRYIKVIIEEISSNIPHISERIEKIRTIKSFLNRYNSKLKIAPEEWVLGVFEYKSLKSDFLHFSSNRGKLIITDNQLIFFDNLKKASILISQINDLVSTGIVRKRAKIHSEFGYVEFTLSNADRIRLYNLLNKLRDSAFSKDTLLLQSITTVSLALDVTKMNAKLTQLVKKFRNSVHTEYGINSHWVSSKEHISMEYAPSTVRKMDSLQYTISPSKVRLIELQSKLQEILNELNTLKKSLGDGKITYTYYIKRYTEKYIEYYRIKSEIDNIIRNKL
ncbi:MAG: hypothetical protein ACP6IS_04745 [Candidatus Asgardarchaeia archaeon]